MNLGPPPKEQTYYNEKKINVPIKGPIKALLTSTV